jgi:DNA transformation protein
VPVSPEFLDYVLEQFEAVGAVTPRRMFGAVGLYRHGLFFGLIDQDIVYLKADATTRADFQAAGGEAFRPFDGPKQALGYWSIPPEALEDPEALALWSDKALAAATAAPTKARRKRSGA